MGELIHLQRSSNIFRAVCSTASTVPWLNEHNSSICSTVNLLWTLKESHASSKQVSKSDSWFNVLMTFLEDLRRICWIKIQMLWGQSDLVTHSRWKMWSCLRGHNPHPKSKSNRKDPVSFWKWFVYSLNIQDFTNEWGFSGQFPNWITAGFFRWWTSVRIQRTNPTPLWPHYLSICLGKHVCNWWQQPLYPVELMLIPTHQHICS